MLNNTLNKKTVIIIEDDRIISEAYKYYVNSFEDFLVKGVYHNVSDALNEYENIYPDIIISDISLPGINGILGAKLFKELDAKAKIIMISVHDDIDHILKAMKNNVDGYLTKPISKEKLFESLNSVSKKNGLPLSFDVSRKIIESVKNKKIEGFSERENEIIQLLKKGLTYCGIGEKLFITTSTVNFHIQNIYAKLNVNKKSEALKKLMEAV